VKACAAALVDVAVAALPTLVADGGRQLLSIIVEGAGARTCLPNPLPQGAWLSGTNKKTATLPAAVRAW
jgi:hypothetical protein